jgi:hypothetical protein
MFVQPDWWEVTWAGVGTNRYSYSFNDPVNGRDPSGHIVPIVAGACAAGVCEAIGVAIGAALGIATAEVASDLSVDGELNGNGALAQTGKATAEIISKTVAGPGHNGGPPLDDESSNGSPQGDPGPIDPKRAAAAGLVLGAAAEASKVFDASGFERSLVRLPSGERVARVKTQAAEIAKERGWIRATDVQKRNPGRIVYRDPKTKELYSVDTQHGRFERLTKDGKHIEEQKMDGTRVPDSHDNSGGHDLKVK